MFLLLFLNENDIFHSCILQNYGRWPDRRQKNGTFACWKNDLHHIYCWSEFMKFLLFEAPKDAKIKLNCTSSSSWEQKLFLFFIFLVGGREGSCASCHMNNIELYQTVHWGGSHWYDGQTHLVEISALNQWAVICIKHNGKTPENTETFLKKPHVVLTWM